MDQESPLEPEETSQEELDSEEDSLETLGKELDQAKALLLRKQAEFKNYRKRIRKERGEQRLAAQAEVFEKLLPTLDALEKGLESLREVPENSELETYRQGYEFMLQEIRSVLDKFEVTDWETFLTPIFTKRCSERLPRSMKMDEFWMNSVRAIRSSTGCCGLPRCESPSNPTRRRSVRARESHSPDYA